MHELPNLNTHLDHAYRVDNSAMLRTVVDRLLRIGTCFAVIGSELEVRTTERGAREIQMLMDRQH